MSKNKRKSNRKYKRFVSRFKYKTLCPRLHHVKDFTIHWESFHKGASTKKLQWSTQDRSIKVQLSILYIRGSTKPIRFIRSWWQQRSQTISFTTSYSIWCEMNLKKFVEEKSVEMNQFKSWIFAEISFEWGLEERKLKIFSFE